VSALGGCGGSTKAVDKSNVANTPNRVAVSSNANGELRLLSNTVRKAKLRSGQTVYATYLPTQRKVFVTPTPVAMTSDKDAVSRRYTVDVKENVRVNLNALGAGRFKSAVTNVTPQGIVEVTLG
jgi:hypothetical protein